MNILECNCSWHFAKQHDASQDVGPNNAAEEHFTATPYPSLIRESIQNSLDREEQAKLAEMGWHCIIVWECELKPQKREGTIDSIAYTLNHLWLKDHHARVSTYQQMEETMQIPMAAESDIAHY